MKVLIALHEIQDLGGIIDHTEHLMWGFEKIGVKCDLKQLCWKETVKDSVRKDKSSIQIGASGIPFDQRNGWIFKKENKIPYMGKDNLKEWKKIAKEYDLIIWSIPVPSSGKANAKNEDWIELYNIKTTQIAIIHDGNFAKTNEKLSLVGVDGLVGVHPCAFNSITSDLPSKLILNPQAGIDENRICRIPYKEKIPGWISLQTFKAWKRVGDIVGSVRYQKNPWVKILAGGGIEYCYMTSKDKVKEQYIHEDGKRIWEEAIKNKMNYSGYMTSSGKERTLKRVKFLIDASWSKKYGQHGEHFNRVTVDAMIKGCVPICRTWSDNPEIILPGINYVELPPVGSSFKEIAACIDSAVVMKKKEYERYRDNNFELIKKFDAKKIAKQYIQFANKLRR